MSEPSADATQTSRTRTAYRSTRIDAATSRSTARDSRGGSVGEVNELTILDIDGSFLMFALAHFPTDPPRESLAVLREVAASIRVDR